MWASILKIFSDSPSQTKVVKFLLENGFGINESGKIICNGIEIPATHLGKATGTDRRVVDATAKRILETSLVREIFLNMRATPDITEIADKLNFAVITIYPKDTDLYKVTEYTISTKVATTLGYAEWGKYYLLNPTLTGQQPKLLGYELPTFQEGRLF